MWTWKLVSTIHHPIKCKKNIIYRFKSCIDKEAGQNGNAIVNISGRDSVDAQQHILEFLKSDRKRSHSQQRNGFNGNQQQNYSGGDRVNGEQFGDQLEIYPDKVGTVIGRGGSTIKELQSKYISFLLLVVSIDLLYFHFF